MTLNLEPSSSPSSFMVNASIESSPPVTSTALIPTGANRSDSGGLHPSALNSVALTATGSLKTGTPQFCFDSLTATDSIEDSQKIAAEIQAANAETPEMLVTALGDEVVEEPQENLVQSIGPGEGLGVPSGVHSLALHSGELTVGERSLQSATSDRVETPAYYIQAALVQHRAFLTTNLSGGELPQVTVLGSTWLMGRSRNCAIMVHDRSISRCHAVVGYDVQQGFYLMDVGSSNGTCLNQLRLAVLKRYPLKDGDIISLCNLKVEFFVATQTNSEYPH